MKRYNWFSTDNINYILITEQYNTYFLFTSGVEFLRFLNSLTYFIFEVQEDENYDIGIKVNWSGSQFRYNKNIKTYRYRTAGIFIQSMNTVGTEYIIYLNSSNKENLIKVLNDFLSWEDSFRYSQNNISIYRVMFEETGNLKYIEDNEE